MHARTSLVDHFERLTSIDHFVAERYLTALRRLCCLLVFVRFAFSFGCVTMRPLYALIDALQMVKPEISS